MDLFVVDTIGGDEQKNKSNVVYSLANDGIDKKSSKNKNVKEKKPNIKQKEWNYYGK